MHKNFLSFMALLGAVSFIGLQSPAVVAQSFFRAKDPGVRGGTADAGAPISVLSMGQLAFFAGGQQEFLEEENVAKGLGPMMNLDSCAC